MKRNCQVCGAEFNPHDYATFNFMKYCSEKCEGQAEAEVIAIRTGVHMYMCIKPLAIRSLDSYGNEVGNAMIEQSSKWQRNDSRNFGKNAIHLVSLSGRKDEPVDWLEIDAEALAVHFERF